MSSGDASSTAQQRMQSSLPSDGCTGTGFAGFFWNLEAGRPFARSRRLASSQNAAARLSQRLRSMTTRNDGSLGDGATTDRAPRWSRSFPRCSLMQIISLPSLPLGMSMRNPCRASSGRNPSPTIFRDDAAVLRAIALLGDLRGIELLIGHFEPVEECLPSGESQRANSHSQAAATGDFLKLLGDGFHSDSVITTLQRTGILHVLVAVTALSSEINIVSSDSRGFSQALNKVPD